MLEDELLKWQFRRGSREALARIYEKYLDPMLTLAMGLLNDAAEAEDVVHDVFVGFARSTNGFTLHGSLSGYLATSVVNRVRDRIRKDRRRRSYLSSPRPAPAETRGPEELVIHSEEARRLAAALAELPYDQREAIVLRLKHKMTFKRIARLQEVPMGTAQARYRYGLDKLRASLNGEVKE
jgi:RNA polymerase sigma-70 factor (ECF subfamily)